MQVNHLKKVNVAITPRIRAELAFRDIRQPLGPLYRAAMTAYARGDIRLSIPLWVVPSGPPSTNLRVTLPAGLTRQHIQEFAAAACLHARDAGDLLELAALQDRAEALPITSGKGVLTTHVMPPHKFVNRLLEQFLQNMDVNDLPTPQAAQRAFEAFVVAVIK